MAITALAASITVSRYKDAQEAAPLLPAAATAGVPIAAEPLGQEEINYLRFLKQCEANREHLDIALQQQAAQQLPLRNHASNDLPGSAARYYESLKKMFQQTLPPPRCKPIAVLYSTYLSVTIRDLQGSSAAFADARQDASTRISLLNHSDGVGRAFNNTIAGFFQQHPEVPPDITGLRIAFLMPAEDMP